MKTYLKSLFAICLFLLFVNVVSAQVVPAVTAPAGGGGGGSTMSISDPNFVGILLAPSASEFNASVLTNRAALASVAVRDIDLIRVSGNAGSAVEWQTEVTKWVDVTPASYGTLVPQTLAIANSIDVLFTNEFVGGYVQWSLARTNAEGDIVNTWDVFYGGDSAIPTPDVTPGDYIANIGITMRLADSVPVRVDGVEEVKLYTRRQYGDNNSWTWSRNLNVWNGGSFVIQSASTGNGAISLRDSTGTYIFSLETAKEIEPSTVWIKLFLRESPDVVYAKDPTAPIEVHPVTYWGFGRNPLIEIVFTGESNNAVIRYSTVEHGQPGEYPSVRPTAYQFINVDTGAVMMHPGGVYSTPALPDGSYEMKNWPAGRWHIVPVIDLFDRPYDGEGKG